MIDPIGTTTGLANSGLPLDRVATDPTLSEEERAAEVGRQFEAILLRDILQRVRKPLLGGESESSSLASDIYNDMIANQLADAISQSGDFGIGTALQAQLTQQFKSDSSSKPVASGPGRENDRKFTPSS